MSADEILRRLAGNARATASSVSQPPMGTRVVCVGCRGPLNQHMAAFTNSTCADCYHRIAAALDKAIEENGGR